MSKNRSVLWRGLSTLTASLLAISVAAGPIVESYRTDIDKFLGTKSSEMVTDNVEGEDLYTYTSDYSSTTELLDAIEDLGERMSEEGTVLLKNENNALPLSSDETQKVSLLGFSSYYPVQGGDMGSSLTSNEGTDADDVNFVEALAAKGFSINEELQNLYKELEPSFKTEVDMWGTIVEHYNIVAPGTSDVFSSKEPSQEIMSEANADWQSSMDDYNVMIVTIARSSSENGTYLPGEDGVDASQDLNQTDPLGLSDDERDLINAAVEAKKSNGGKVIVMLNNANAMEIDEIKNNSHPRDRPAGRLRILRNCRCTERRCQSIRPSLRHLRGDERERAIRTELRKLRVDQCRCGEQHQLLRGRGRGYLYWI
jgi:beta-glucosidase